MWKTTPIHNNVYFKYFGGSGGRPFSGRGYIRSQETHISCIRVRSSAQINGIQVSLNLHYELILESAKSFLLQGYI